MQQKVKIIERRTAGKLEIAINKFHEKYESRSVQIVVTPYDHTSENEFNYLALIKYYECNSVSDK